MKSDKRPVRLQLSRRKGFDLQALSRRQNGLPARSVARPSEWSNPFKVSEHGRECAISLFEDYIRKAIAEGKRDPSALRGFNLACWCNPFETCHADILLRLTRNPN